MNIQQCTFETFNPVLNMGGLIIVYFLLVATFAAHFLFAQCVKILKVKSDKPVQALEYEGGAEVKNNEGEADDKPKDAEADDNPSDGEEDVTESDTDAKVQISNF